MLVVHDHQGGEILGGDAAEPDVFFFILNSGQVATPTLKADGSAVLQITPDVFSITGIAADHGIAKRVGVPDALDRHSQGPRQLVAENELFFASRVELELNLQAKVIITAIERVLFGDGDFIFLAVDRHLRIWNSLEEHFLAIVILDYQPHFPFQLAKRLEGWVVTVVLPGFGFAIVI